MGRIGLRVAAGALTLVTMLSFALPATGAPLPAEDYPSWDEVLSARADESAAADLIGSIGGLLDQLQAESARLGDAAIQSAAAASTASTARDAAAAVADRLAEQADAAAQRAEQSTSRAAQVVAAMVRSSGPDLPLALLAEDDGALLVRLGLLERIGGQLDAIVELATIDRNAANALAAQAEDAQNILAGLAKTAQRAADDAAAAAATAEARVAEQQAHLSELYEQLAALRNTSAEQERLFRIGQEVSGTPTEPGGGGSGGNDDLGSIGSQYNNPPAAQAYAWSWFSHFGWTGPDQTWCLVMLWNRESGWRTNAYNASSGAYGIPQSLPGVKMAAVGPDWRTNFQTQVLWGLVYINNSYGSPCAAWSHSEAVGWY